MCIDNIITNIMDKNELINPDVRMRTRHRQPRALNYIIDFPCEHVNYNKSDHAPLHMLQHTCHCIIRLIHSVIGCTIAVHVLIKLLLSMAFKYSKFDNYCSSIMQFDSKITFSIASSQHLWIM